MAQPKLLEVDYYTIHNGKIISLPVQGKAQSERCYEEELMDFVGRQMLWLVPALIVVLLAYHYNGFILGAVMGAALVRWAAKRMGWW